jgi:predicted Zn-ribbon and HTH transcriptional regulator
MNEKIQTIADEIIGYSDGSFNIEWGEEYTALTIEEQREVKELVYDSIGNCNDCGWHFNFDSMETHADGQSYCWQCYEDVIEREEGEETE